MHAYIIHGYGASPTDHWFPWLQARLQAAGIPTIVPPLPDSEHPDFAAWQATLTQTIGTPDRNTLLIAHSLGTISLLHYLSATRPASVGGLVIPRVIIQGKTRDKSDFGNPQIWKHCCECWQRPPMRAAFLLAVVPDDEFATGCFSFRPAHGVG